MQAELNLLDQMLEKSYILPEDLALPGIPDSQGLGTATAREDASLRPQNIQQFPIKR